MTGAWRILVADDHPVVRAGLRALLAGDPRCEVVGEAASLDELRAAIHHLRPDLVLLDLSFGAANALDELPSLLAAPRPPKVVVLTMHDDVSFARQAFLRGAHGYLVKEAAAEELTGAVATVMGGSTYLHAELGARLAVAARQPDDRLTTRERDVLVLLSEGHTNAEVAERLAVSLRTVETHRAHLRDRLGVHGRAEMVLAARRLGLVR